METIHIDLLVENGYAWAAVLLYEASEEKSVCRKHMDTSYFRNLVLSKVVKHNTFADVIAITNEMTYKNGTDYSLLPTMAREGKWELVHTSFYSLCSGYEEDCDCGLDEDVESEGIILETLIELIGTSELDKCKDCLLSVGSSFHFLHELYTTFAYKMSIAGHECFLRGSMNREVLVNYLQMTDDVEVLAILVTYIRDIVNVKLLFNRVVELLDLNVAENRKRFNSLFYNYRSMMSEAIDLSKYHRRIYSCQNGRCYERVVKDLEEEGILLDNFSANERRTLPRFEKGPMNWISKVFS